MRLSSYLVVTPPVETAHSPRPVRLVFATRTAEALVMDDEAWRMVEAGRYDALPELPTFHVAKATHTHTFSHPLIKTGHHHEVVDATHQPAWSEH